MIPSIPLLLFVSNPFWAGVIHRFLRPIYLMDRNAPHHQAQERVRPRHLQAAFEFHPRIGDRRHTHLYPQMVHKEGVRGVASQRYCHPCATARTLNLLFTCQFLAPCADQLLAVDYSAVKLCTYGHCLISQLLSAATDMAYPILLLFSSHDNPTNRERRWESG